MTTKQLLLQVITLSFLLVGCASNVVKPTQSRPGDNGQATDLQYAINQMLPLADNIKQIRSQLETLNQLQADASAMAGEFQLSLTNLLGIITNISPPILAQNRIYTIANGATNYSVKIHYTDYGQGQGVQFTNAMKAIFGLGQSLLNFNPDLKSYLSQSSIQQFVETLDLLDQLKNVSTGKTFQTNLTSQIDELLVDQLAAFSQNASTNFVINVSLPGLAATYMKAYLQGSFVDRWGVPVSQPDITKWGNDTTEAFTKVLLEALMDYAYMTPIVYDPNQASTNKTPTFAVIFPALYEKTSTDPSIRGVTSAELEAINYLSGLSDEEAKHVSSFLIRMVGGASIGAKVSTGDNDTLAQILSTICEETSRRSAEDITYNFFEGFEYYPTNAPPGYAPDIGNNDRVLGNNSLIAKNRGVDSAFQAGIVYLLVTQDDLEALITGGWKLSTNNIVDYEGLANALIGTNGLSTNIFSNLPESAQQAVRSATSHPITAAQMTVLVSGLNHVLSSEADFYHSNTFTNLSNESKMLVFQCRTGAGVMRLNRSLLFDAFPTEFSRSP
jgi:hypothetical protein